MKMSSKFKFLLLILAFLFFFTINSCGDVVSPPQIEDKFATAITTATFLPNNPEDMTAAEKTWFSQKVFDIDLAVILKDAMTSLSQAQKNLIQLEVEAYFKTFNYLVFTKPFAVYLQKLQKENALVSVTTDPNDTPDLLAFWLSIRALNSKTFYSNEIRITLDPSAANYTGILDGKSILSAQNATFTDSDINAAEWDFWRAIGDNKNKAFINVPVKYLTNVPNNHTYLAESQTYCSDSTTGMGTFLKYNLIIHELLHTVYDWGHPKPLPADSIDLVYAIHRIVGQLTWGWGDGPSQVASIPSAGLNNLSPALISVMGGHLPFSRRCKESSYGYYNVFIQYLLNKEGKTADLPDFQGDLYTTKYTGTVQIPPDPFNGVNWANMRFTGFRNWVKGQ